MHTTGNNNAAKFKRFTSALLLFCLLVQSALTLPASAGETEDEEDTAGTSIYYGISLSAHGIWGITDKTPHGNSTTAFLTSRNKGESLCRRLLNPARARQNRR